jgi:hypothetical protein
VGGKVSGTGSEGGEGKVVKEGLAERSSVVYHTTCI